MRRRWVVCAIPMAVAAGCRRARREGAARIDPALAAAVPGDSVVLAGMRMEELRGTLVHQWIAGRLPTLAEAEQVLAFYHGRALGLAAKVSSGVVVWNAGARGGAPPADLLSRGEVLAGEGPIWAVARGGISLPLTGNAANLNRFLRGVEYATLRGDLRDGLHAVARGECRSEDAAAALEETVRAFLTLASAAGRERVETSLAREGSTVAVRFSASQEQARAMLAGLLR
jgi:hypothetical protein